VTIDVRIGATVFHASPFRNYEGFRAFLGSVAEDIVPGKKFLNLWKGTGGGWDKPPMRGVMAVPTGLQGVVFDRFGNRDAEAQSSMISRMAKVAGLDGKGFRKAVRKALPPARFFVDLDELLGDGEKNLGSWQMFGEVEFEHFILRAPGGRIEDWALLSVPLDFSVLKEYRGPRRLTDPRRAVTVARDAVVAENMPAE
jgi:hypothetical protein